MNKAVDHAIREQALDTRESFIVQAPAGSGKTELLTQRYLALLAQAEKAPEEIIAITFTRKAAAEMRERILQSLQLAQADQPTEAHKKRTWQLARQALLHDARQQWRLLDNPNRLRILTLDALASHLCRQLPMLSQSIANLSVTDDAKSLYQHAIEESIRYCIQQPELASTLQSLLLHLDNRPAQLSSMLMQLLGKREQWLPHLLQHSQDVDSLRDYMRTALLNINQEIIDTLNKQIDNHLKLQLIDCLQIAASELTKSNPEHPICQINRSTAPPDSDISSRNTWHAIAQALLKSDGEWRKTVDKRQGFSKGSDNKQHFIAILNSISDNDILKNALQDLLNCPPIDFTAQQWQLIQSLLKILPIVAAQCRVSFFEHGSIDFVELNIAAQHALGSPDEPTDLALQLDYRIKHMLIDEFQDTSITQYKLLETLTAGWQHADGRTLFLVGDPMQSIYRFREADVSLFIRAKQIGVGQIQLLPLALQQNFRSTANIVDWVNQCFSQVFPRVADVNTAAIPFSAAIALDARAAAISTATFATDNRHSEHNLANQKSDDTTAIQYHALVDSTLQQQAQHVASLIHHYQTLNPSNSIAILVRSRSHLIEITQQLKQQQIAFEAVDIDPLQDTTEIMELLTLTRAMLHRADNIAWLSLLRAPYCGLYLKDLHMIATGASHCSVWQSMQQRTALSQDAQQRLTHICSIIQQALAKQGIEPYHRWLKKLWLALDIPANYSASQRQHCEVYFDCLLEMQAQGVPISVQHIQQRLAKLYAKPVQTGDHPVSLMTIHKSKGLEFDHVILPQLDRRTQNDQQQLLLWQERLNQYDQRDLIMAPIKHVSEARDPIYHYLSTIEKQKAYYESQRLLYVACTRAKLTLDLLLQLDKSDDKDSDFRTPSKNSFAGMLWPHYKQAFTDNIIVTTATSTAVVTDTPRRFQRYRHLNTEMMAVDQPERLNHDINIALEDSYASSIGTITHAVLQQLSRLTLTQLQAFDIETQLGNWRCQLNHAGIQQQQQEAALQQIKHAISNTLNDPQGLWILRNDRAIAHSEYPLCMLIHNTVQQLIIDRWFIEDDMLWIIDYKITQDSQHLEQYDAQLQHYQQALQRLYPQHSITAAVYLPLQCKLIQRLSTQPEKITD